MTNTIKNTTEYNNFIKYIKDNKEGINENQTIEIEVSEKTRIDTVELTIQTIMLLKKASKKEIIESKKLANNSLNIHAYSKTRIELAFRIAGSNVISKLLKTCKDKESIEKKLLKVCNGGKLSQTSINTYKNKNTVNDKGSIVKKEKKAKVTSKKEVQPKKLDDKSFIKKLSNEKLQELSDLVNQEIELRGQESINKDAMTG
tara:strand:- start:242 stop:847 length:606 start_codon:yes stop_codon:yes gene_type:complete